MSAPIEMSEAVSQGMNAAEMQPQQPPEDVMEVADKPIEPNAAATLEFNESVQQAIKSGDAAASESASPLSQMFGAAADLQSNMDQSRNEFHKMVEESNSQGPTDSELAAQFDEPTRNMLQSLRDMGQESIQMQAKMNDHALEFQADMSKVKWFQTVVGNLVSSVKGLVERT